MLLPRRLGQPLAPRSQPEAFHRLVLLLEAVVGTLQFAVGRARLVKLTLQVAELILHLVESLENATKEFLAGGQIIRDLSGSLRHDDMYVLDGALGREFSRFFRNSLQRISPRGRNVCAGVPRPSQLQSAVAPDRSCSARCRLLPSCDQHMRGDQAAERFRLRVACTR